MAGHARALLPSLATILLLSTPAGAIDGGGAFGINLVRLEGVLGVRDAPTSLMDVTLLVGRREIPFSVLSARRMSGPPENGVGVLLPLGSSQPNIRLMGEPTFVDPIATAPPGTTVTLLGNLRIPTSVLELMGVDLPPSTGAKKDGQRDQL